MVGSGEVTNGGRGISQTAEVYDVAADRWDLVRSSCEAGGGRCSSDNEGLAS